MPSIDATADQFRSFYASCMAAAARQPAWPPGYAWQTRLEGAFEAVPREMFLPPGPWHIEAAPGRYVETPNADSRFLYQDVLVAIDKERGINNGQPSGHARFMGQLEPRPGETVVHIGAGTGYYTAILSVLVTPDRAGFCLRVARGFGGAGTPQSANLRQHFHNDGRRHWAAVARSRCDLRECRRHQAAAQLVAGPALRRPNVRAVAADG